MPGVILEQFLDLIGWHPKQRCDSQTGSPRHSRSLGGPISGQCVPNSVTLALGPLVRNLPSPPAEPQQNSTSVRTKVTLQEKPPDHTMALAAYRSLLRAARTAFQGITSAAAAAQTPR